MCLLIVAWDLLLVSCLRIGLVVIMFVVGCWLGVLGGCDVCGGGLFCLLDFVFGCLLFCFLFICDYY